MVSRSGHGIAGDSGVAGDGEENDWIRRFAVERRLGIDTMKDPLKKIFWRWARILSDNRPQFLAKDFMEFISNSMSCTVLGSTAEQITYLCQPLQ